MKKYYIRWQKRYSGYYWVIYKKRKWFFDKKVSEFYCAYTCVSQDYFKYYVKPELERLEKE